MAEPTESPGRRFISRTVKVVGGGAIFLFLVCTGLIVPRDAIVDTGDEKMDRVGPDVDSSSDRAGRSIWSRRFHAPIMSARKAH